MMRKLIVMILCIAAFFLSVSGCQNKHEKAAVKEKGQEIVIKKKGAAEAIQKEELPKNEQQAEVLPAPLGKKIVIDAGHQEHGDSEQEPVGPGASAYKAKVASGTQGVVTRIPEYELTLQVSVQLEQVLKQQGYEVVMIRNAHQVNISNAQRAEVANQAQADAFIRIHANGAETPLAEGVLTMCMTAQNPYNANLYAQSRRLSETVLTQICNKTGAKNAGIIETDTMSGINWCAVPVTIVEMGFMSNPQEDQLLNTADYQSKMAEGIAAGINEYFRIQQEKE